MTAIAALAGHYALELDFEGVGPLLVRHQLRFG